MFPTHSSRLYFELLLVYSSVCGSLTENSAAVNIGVQVFEYLFVFNSFGVYGGIELQLCFFFFLAAPLRLAGSQFPDRGLNPGDGSESAKS